MLRHHLAHEHRRRLQGGPGEHHGADAERAGRGPHRLGHGRCRRGEDLPGARLPVGGGEGEEHHVAAQRAGGQPQLELLGQPVPRGGPVHERARRGVLMQAAVAPALARRPARVDPHVVEGRGAARAGLQRPPVLQDRQPDPRLHVHGRAQSALGLLAAPEAAQRRAGRLVRADRGDVQIARDLAQQRRAVRGEVVGEGDADAGRRMRTGLGPQRRQRPVEGLAHGSAIARRLERHRDPGLQRAGEVHRGQRQPIGVDGAADGPAGLVVQSQQRGALAPVGARESALHQQSLGEEAFDGVGDGGRGDPELAGDLDPAGLRAAPDDLEDRGVRRGGSAFAGGAHRDLLLVAVARPPAAAARERDAPVSHSVTAARAAVRDHFVACRARGFPLTGGDLGLHNTLTSLTK